jgi:hypothetical protein
MKRNHAKAVLFSCFVSLFLMFVGTPAHSACSCTYVAELGPIPCDTSTCDGDYYEEWCDFGGCTYGECSVTGYGHCCASLSYKVYNVSTSGCDPNYNCGGNCPPIRKHAASHTDRHSSVEARATRTSVPANQTAVRADWDDDVLFVPDRCQHTYGIVELDAGPIGDVVSAKSKAASLEIHP